MRLITKSLLAVASISLYLTSCKKTEVPGENLPLNAIAAVDTTGTDSLIVKRTKLLTDSTWRYYEYYLNYSQDSAKLVWKYGKTSNQLNLSLNRTKFNPGGSYYEITETGATLTGSWEFLNNATQLKVVNSYGTFVSNIRELTANTFEWQSVDGATYGVEKAVVPTTDYTKSAFAKLTGRTWKYQAYFYNYPAAAATLAYRNIARSNPVLNLGLNTVTFKTDYTFTQVDQNGVTSTGTWSLSNGDTRITTKQDGNYPSFPADIKVLTSDRFEWNRIDNNNYYYGEQVAL